MKKLLTCVLAAIIAAVPVVGAAFSDVTEEHWAWANIKALSDAKIINGYTDGSFKPDENVTRAEFAKMIGEAFDIGESEGYEYSDVSDHWAKSYITNTAQYIYTPDDTLYMPDSKATRGEIAYALASVLKLPAALDKTGAEFSDFELTEPAIAPKLASAVEYGLVNGYEDNTLRADNPVTRAEAAALIDRALQYDAADTDLPSDTAEPDNIGKDTNEDADNGVTPGTEATTSPDEKKDTDNKTDSSNEKSIFPEGTEHMYTRNPLKDLYIISDVTSTIDTSTGNDGYRLRYRIAGYEEEYSTLIPDDDTVRVSGTKTSLSQIRRGDVIIMSTAFLAHIDVLYVVASFGGSNPDPSTDAAIPSGSKVGELGSDKDYEFAFGTVESLKKKTKSTNVILNTPNGEKTAFVNSQTKVEVYSPRLKSVWKSDRISAIDEGAFVLIRYTDGVPTEAVVYTPQ